MVSRGERSDTSELTVFSASVQRCLATSRSSAIEETLLLLLLLLNPSSSIFNIEL